jgi:protein phosphatase
MSTGKKAKPSAQADDWVIRCEKRAAPAPAARATHVLKKGAMTLTTGSVTDRGLVRPRNEDHAYENTAGGVFCVADGMGGGQGGAKASEIACAHVASSLEGAQNYDARAFGVSASVMESHEAIRRFAEKAGYTQMGTTLVAAVFDLDRARLLAVHVGDSRLYRWRDGALERLTADHTIEPGSHILNRAIGIGEVTWPDCNEFDLRAGDRYLLCSDGVHGMLSDAQMANVFSLGGSPLATVARLQVLTVLAGAEDNYTAIVVNVD